MCGKRELAELFEVEKALEIHFILDGDAIGYADGRMTKAELREAIGELLGEVE